MFPSSMSEASFRNLIHERLDQLRCHFTWDLVIQDIDIPDLENRILEIRFLNTRYHTGMRNLQAYVKHLQGQHEEALRCLEEAEDLIHGEQADQWEGRSLVTWGNYAWVHFHRGQLEEAQTYLDKVGNICEKLGSPFRYRVECPEMDCEEGWALLKCGGQYYRRALGCFTKAVEVEPENPEFSKGYAIVAYRLDHDDSNSISLEPLQKAFRLNPGDAYIKVLLALKLWDVGQTTEAETYMEDALTNMSFQSCVYRYAGKLYLKKGFVERALQLFKRALETAPSSSYLYHQIGRCYKKQVYQIKEATNMQPRGDDNEKLNQSIHLAMFHFQRTLQLKPTFEMAYVNLAEMHAETGQYREAEENFQTVLSMQNLNELFQQNIRFCYGNFQQFHKKFEDGAITQYLKGLKINIRSHFREKLLKALEKLAQRRVRQNIHVVESTSLLAFVHKLRGEVNEALQCYEEAVRVTAKLSPVFVSLMYS